MHQQTLCGGCQNHQRGKEGPSTQHQAAHPCQGLLLCNLTMATGTRPGNLNNVLVSDYETSRVSADYRIILVP